MKTFFAYAGAIHLFIDFVVLLLVLWWGRAADDLADDAEVEIRPEEKRPFAG